MVWRGRSLSGSLVAVPTKKPNASGDPPGSGARPSTGKWLWWVVGAVVAALVAVALAQPSARHPDDEQTETVDLVNRHSSTPTRPSTSADTAAPEALQVRVVRRLPHAADAFTQGLLWHDGKLYESTGLNARSSLRRVDMNTGEVEAKVDVARNFFAEGLARVGQELFQLTWQSGVAIVYDLETFEEKRRFEYEGEGWGLCFDGAQLVMSDGSDRLVFRDPANFEPRGEIHVTKAGVPVRNLNELECVNGEVYANVWQRNELVRIDPRSGRVTATIEAGRLLTPQERRRTDVLNGIAALPQPGRFAITGKYWPTLFEVEFVPR